ncbi:hypothetical protein P3L10_019325 [Capsicum annuum]
MPRPTSYRQAPPHSLLFSLRSPSSTELQALHHNRQLAAGGQQILYHSFPPVHRPNREIDGPFSGVPPASEANQPLFEKM